MTNLFTVVLKYQKRDGSDRIPKKKYYKTLCLDLLLRVWLPWKYGNIDKQLYDKTKTNFLNLNCTVIS